MTQRHYLIFLYDKSGEKILRFCASFYKELWRPLLSYIQYIYKRRWYFVDARNFLSHKTENLLVLRFAVCVKICVVKRIAICCRHSAPAYAVAGEEREFYLPTCRARCHRLLFAEFQGGNSDSLRIACAGKTINSSNGKLL